MRRTSTSAAIVATMGRGWSCLRSCGGSAWEGKATVMEDTRDRFANVFLFVYPYCRMRCRYCVEGLTNKAAEISLAMM